ncbi:MAG: HAMP domain-containing histidine kinase [Deltaproteobacteria bacterium]|nr:HAMP domain-containing histidine kinase [Deltaproteobacteria bacterium]
MAAVHDAHPGPDVAAEQETSADRSLAAFLGRAAARAAEQTAGGAALLLVGGPSQARPRLRAAAGLDSPEQAREISGALSSLIRDVMSTATRQVREGDPASLGQQSGGVLGLPLQADDGPCHGVLLVLCPREPSLAMAENAAQLAGSVALRIDHDALRERVNELEGALAQKEPAIGQDGDEILKLSEALFAQDIELLQSQEKLGSVQRLKNDFIEKMSRELRTPLNSIIESVISVLAGENENLSEAGKANLRNALDEGTAFLRTLQNILDLWRLKQSELPIAQQTVNFREVVEEAIFSVQDTLGSKPVVIEKKIVEPLPKLRTDLPKVNQILFLLLDNAAKFIEQGRIEIGAEVRDDRLYCTIQDTGIGICADDQEFIFEEFFQVDDTSSSAYRGAGLGLTLVRELLDLMGGEIELSSEVGRGTRVGFSVPVTLA